ncbi:hypothetical protein VDGL01_05419 [Verticillium dahliae]
MCKAENRLPPSPVIRGSCEERGQPPTSLSRASAAFDDTKRKVHRADRLPLLVRATAVALTVYFMKQPSILRDSSDKAQSDPCRTFATMFTGRTRDFDDHFGNGKPASGAYPGARGTVLLGLGPQWPKTRTSRPATRPRMPHPSQSSLARMGLARGVWTLWAVQDDAKDHSTMIIESPLKEHHSASSRTSAIWVEPIFRKNSDPS